MTNARLILVPTAALIAGLVTAAVGVMGYSAVRKEHPGRTGDPRRQTRETGAASLVGHGPPRPTAARPAADQRPVILEVDVVDPAGRRLAGVDVAVVAWYSRKSAPNESVLKRTKTNGVERIRMDLARETPDATVYYASVWAYQPGRALDTSSVRITGPAGSPFISDWVMLSGERATIPAIRLQPLQQLTGQINDRQGRPVAGARVFVPAGGPATATDDQGRFSLAGINPGKTVVLAEQAGFRLQGWLTDPSAHAQVGPFTLLRTSETPDSVIKPVTDPIPPADSRALANRLLEPYLHEAIENGPDARIPAAISTLGEFDPDRALELLQNAKFADDDLSYQNLRLSLATRLAAANPVGAEALAEAIPLAQTKIRALASVAKAIPANERARKIAMLDKAAKLLKDDVPAEYGNRLRLIAAVAEQWLDMGELDRARRVLEEGKTSDNFFQTGFLGQLARLEPQQVIARLQKLPTGVDSYSRNLEMAEVAVQLATDHPAEAEQVFNLRNGGNEPGHAKNYVSRLCRRLARVDPTRARRIAASLSDPGIRACAWAYVALGLTEKDRAGAAEAIDRAIEELDRLRESGGKLELSGLIVGGIVSVGPVHPAAILPIVEQVAPERLAEVFWRVVALHPRIDTDREDLIQRAYIGCECALLARYDREVAAALFEPMDSCLQVLAGHTGPLPGFIPNVITAKGCIDPPGAVVLVETLTPAGDFNRSDPAFVARLRLAEVLGAPPERRWMRLCRSFGTQLDD